MAYSIYLKNIQRLLFLYTDLVEQSNSMGLFDDAVTAENFFCSFLNTAFGWNLTNANELKTNQDSFDLIDKRKGLAIQVTSNKNHKAKLTRSVSTLEQNNKNKGIKTFIILFISKKCPTVILKKVKSKEFVYEAYDIPKLLSKLYYENKLPGQLKDLNKILEDAVSPVSISNGFQFLEDTSKQLLKPQPATLKKDGLYIYRKELIENIFTFAQISNGLLVGNPGVGKSFTIEELQRLCTKKRVPCFIIRINDLVSGSDDEISKELKTSANWIRALKKISYKSKELKAILIFDAFDTAKDEKLKSGVLKHIKSAINELKETWNILVSARTYDAEKSPRLLELFPQTNIIKPVSCRYFEIPDLSEPELELAIQKNKKISSVLRKSTKDLRILLRTPYFLKLFEKIVNDCNGFKSKNVISIETEEQLLEVFWNTRVAEKTDKDQFLRKLTQILANKENLSCPKEAIISDSNFSVFDNLMSLGVITESSVTKQNITFSHNILLDFAISKYLIIDDPDSLVEFTNTNQKMPFLFRPSFIYFYSKLWNLDKPLFWKHYFKIRSVDTALFRLYHQTILNYILGRSYRDIRELSPVFDLNQEERGNTIRKILEGVRFISKGRIRDRDYILFYRFTHYMHESFLWELGFLIDKAIQALKENPNSKKRTLISKAVANYLRFVLVSRKLSPNKALIDNNGGYWGIKNACAVFSDNIPAFSKLLKKVLEILKEEDFPIRLFYTLSDCLLDLFNDDKQLAITIYKVLYYHSENSDKETYLGSSVVMALRSNRRQDFESIHHKLEQDFKVLVARSPDIMIPLGLEIVNKFSIDKKRYRTISKPALFKVYGFRAKITADFEYYDSEHDMAYGPLSHLENILSLLKTKLNEGKLTHAIRLIKLIARHAETSTIWRKLIKLFAEYPGKLKKEAFELLFALPILIFDETVYDAGELLKILWPMLSLVQKKKLEIAILSIRSSKLIVKEHDLVDRRLSRLLNCIPKGELACAESKDYIRTHEKRENNPLVTRPRLQSHYDTREEKMIRAGIDSSNDFELTVYKTIEIIDPFTTKYDYNNNNKPLKSEYSVLLDPVKGLFNIIKIHSFSNPKFKSTCDYEVSRFAKLLARHGSKLNKSLRAFILDVAFHYINSDEYKNSVYETGDLKNSHGAYSPTPRSEAAQTIAQLVYSDKTGKIPPVLLDLISDNTQIIRFKALHTFTYFWHYYRDQFWDKVKERCQLEKDGLCLHRVMDSIHYSNIMQSNQFMVEEAATLLMANLKEADDSTAHEIWHMYVVLVLKLVIFQESKVALNIIAENLHIKEFSRQLIFNILTVIDPHNVDNNYVMAPAKHQNLIQFLQDIVSSRFDSIKTKGLTNIAIKDDFEIIDTCIQHLYFTIETGKKENKGKKLSHDNKAAFFNIIKPLLNFIANESAKIDKGFMVAHTGYYFMQLLNSLLSIDPEEILTLSSSVVNSAAASGFTYDNTTLGEIVKLTEKILADYKELLSKKEHLNSLITILDLFANSGWQEALELTWRLKDVF